MKREHSDRSSVDQGRSGRRWFFRVIILCAVMALLGGAYLQSEGVPRAWLYARRLAEAERAWEDEGASTDLRIEPHLFSLAYANSPAAQRALESFIRRKKGSAAASLVPRALQLLMRHYPNSNLVAGCRAYAGIRGSDNAFNYFHGDEEPIDETQAVSFGEWLRRFPGHPGRDDAHYLLARFHREAGRYSRAFDYSIQALAEPDGDKREVVHRFFGEVVLSADENALQALVDGGACPQEYVVQVEYMLALQALRELRFGEALARLKNLDASELWRRQQGETTGPRRVVSIPAEAVAPQVEFAREMEVAWREYETHEGESAASRLHEIAKRCFHERDVFRNRLLPDPEDLIQPKGELAVELHPSSGYRQAFDLFGSIEERYPNYSRLDEVTYSRPLCFWRVRRKCRQQKAYLIDPEISHGFARLVRRFPQSSLVDEAMRVIKVVEGRRTRWTPGQSVRGPDWRWIERYLGEGIRWRAKPVVRDLSAVVLSWIGGGGELPTKAVAKRAKIPEGKRCRPLLQNRTALQNRTGWEGADSSTVKMRPFEVGFQLRP